MYWLFVDPETLEVIRGDKASGRLESGTDPKKGEPLPVLPVYIADYDNEKIFGHVWAIYDEDEVMKRPRLIFLDEVRARQKVIELKEPVSDGWGAAYSMGDIIAPKNTEIKLIRKKVGNRPD